MKTKSKKVTSKVAKIRKTKKKPVNRTLSISKKKDPRGRPINPNSIHQQRLRRWAEMRAAGIPVLRGRPKKHKRGRPRKMAA